MDTGQLMKLHNLLAIIMIGMFTWIYVSKKVIRQFFFII